jgi:hypothetical protein
MATKRIEFSKFLRVIDVLQHGSFEAKVRLYCTSLSFQSLSHRQASQIDIKVKRAQFLSVVKQLLFYDDKTAEQQPHFDDLFAVLKHCLPDAQHWIEMHQLRRLCSQLATTDTILTFLFHIGGPRV